MIELEHDGPVATVWLARPDKRNALTPGGLDALCEALDRLGDSTRAVVLAARGRVFCGGFDLDACAGDDTVLPALLRGLARTIERLRAAPWPVVAAVHGAAVAGGCALVCGADIVVADSACRFGYPVLPLGISPAVSAPALALTVGQGVARARLLDPALVDAQRARQDGLVHLITSRPDDVLPMAVEVASELARLPVHAVRATRRWLHRLCGPEPEQSRQALLASLSVCGLREQRERLAARRRT